MMARATEVAVLQDHIQHRQQQRRGMDIYSQALKALALRCPFGGDDGGGAGGGGSSSGGPLLRLSSSGDAKRKNRARKTQAVAKKRNFGEMDNGESNPKLFWAQMEDYFREVSVDDIQLLFPRTRLGLVDANTAEDPCFWTTPLGPRYMDVWGEEDRKYRIARELEAEAALEQLTRGVKRKLLTANPVSKRRKAAAVPSPSSAAAVTVVISPAEADDEDLCHVCFGAEGDSTNQLIYCDSCNMAAHQLCYGVRSIPEGQWYCSWCTSRTTHGPPAGLYCCVLCPVKGGALKPVADASDGPQKQRRFAHLVCCQWVPETYIRDTEAMEPVINVEGIREERWRFICVICKERHGACIQCSHGSCSIAFHPLCARGSRCWMEVSGREDSEEIELHAFCPKHSAGRLGRTLRADADKAGLDPGSPIDGDAIVGRPGSIKGKSLPKRGPEQAVKFSDLNDDQLRFYVREVLDHFGVPLDTIVSETGLSGDVLTLWLQGNAHAADQVNTGVSEWLQAYHSSATGTGDDDHGKDRGGGVICVSSTGKEAVGLEEEKNVLQVDRSLDVNCNSLTNSENHEGVLGLVEDPDDGKFLEEDKGEVEVRGGPPFEVPKCTISKAEDWTKDNSSSEDESADDVHEADSGDLQQASSPLEAEQSAEYGKNNLQPYVVPQILAKLRRLEQNRHVDLVRPSTAEAGNLSEDRTHECADRLDEASALNNQWEQLRQAKQLGILDWIPQDELEGELFILQSQLIDCAQSNLHSSEKLIARILSQLAAERHAARKIMQELYAVSQFISDAKEAKKLGRKEKRDREAQAVLAAATAAAAASPRAGYVRRDAAGYEDTYYDPTLPHSNGNPHSPTVRSLRPPIPRPPRLNISSSFRISQVERLAARSNTNAQESHPNCDVCNSSVEVTRSNRILQCGRCKVAVHQECYGVSRFPSGPWFCQPCTEAQMTRVEGGDTKPSMPPQCALCPSTQGAFRKSSDGRWVHMFCALWVPETTVGKEQGAAVGGLDAVPVERFNLICSICQQQQGACVKCNFGHCYGAFHPICARDAGLYMSVKTAGAGGRTCYRAYCERHSPHQRAKAELKQCSTADELTALRQIRVEFERVRLICERICKRERIKRELANCVKDLYVSQLNMVAVSNQGVNGGWQPDANKVASEVPPEAAWKPLMDPLWSTNTSAGGSTEGQVEVPIRESKEQPKKLRRYGYARHSEPLGREKVMTPSEASMHNRLLPKGYAYVPVDMLEKGVVTLKAQQQQQQEAAAAVSTEKQQQQETTTTTSQH